MAKKRKGQRPEKRENLEDLPQQFDVWQVDARLTNTTVRHADQAVQPWIILVVSESTDEVLAFELLPDTPSMAELEETLQKAIKEPTAGEPHRPTMIHVRQEGWAEGLQPFLQAITVECETVEALDLLDEVFDELSAQLSGQLSDEEPPGLLDMPGVTPETVASLFDAAALFFEQAPWKKTGERPIKVECAKFESSPWYAIVMGQGGMSRGLVLYDRLETLQRIQQGDLSEEESARMTAGLAVVFGAKDDLVSADAEALEQHEWRVAGADAYPSVYRMEPGLNMRPPLVWEIQLLEGCLRGLPEFARKKTRRLEPFTIAVPTAGGELSLVLSWADE